MTLWRALLAWSVPRALLVLRQVVFRRRPSSELLQLKCTGRVITAGFSDEVCTVTGPVQRSRLVFCVAYAEVRAVAQQLADDQRTACDTGMVQRRGAARILEIHGKPSREAGAHNIQTTISRRLRQNREVCCLERGHHIGAGEAPRLIHVTPAAGGEELVTRGE